MPQGKLIVAHGNDDSPYDLISPYISQVHKVNAEVLLRRGTMTNHVTVYGDYVQLKVFLFKSIFSVILKAS